MLKVKNLSVKYGAIHALKDVSLEVTEGNIITLIGANGAGKSTLLKTISGLLKPAGGSIEFKDEKIDGLKAQNIVKKGVIHVPEGRRMFSF